MLQIGIQPEKREQERSDMGESVFPETDPISLFLGLFIYFLLHIGMNTESRGSQQSWPLSKSGASHKCIKKVLGVLHHLLAMRPADILWSFLSDTQKTYLIIDIERDLETDTVVGKLAEKRRLNNLVSMEYQSPPT